MFLSVRSDSCVIIDIISYYFSFSAKSASVIAVDNSLISSRVIIRFFSCTLRCAAHDDILLSPKHALVPFSLCNSCPNFVISPSLISFFNKDNTLGKVFRYSIVKSLSNMSSSFFAYYMLIGFLPENIARYQ